MKTIHITVWIILFSFISLVAKGRYNYLQACEYIQNHTDRTDIDISSSLYMYGFNLDWDENPNVKDYIKSNFL